MLFPAHGIHIVLEMGSKYVRAHRDGRAGGDTRVVSVVRALAVLRLRLGTVDTQQAER